ncbi:MULTISPECIES: hypothetical protein [unclassified Cupriavidus]|uniref:hypothetical protein n=1 Tax=unclassified Cupriavidus TaxID=2640874 RepID=UPI001BFFDB21|nr:MULTISPECIES: hypothetical protein [unclassified Cupriavidus]MCA3198214.1 hypothetical protein [Cupriavidus sp.]MCA3204981.1 hypothetical protein [Cupriavidus sp.]MCA3208568.1 hypothetical protein [Cupriavidus sp.]QWE94365.1 hypothetical protein KLP38_16435 [Cupriavidus sp. EM10]
MIVLAAMARPALARHACLYPETNYNGTPQCFQPDKVYDLTPDFEVKSVTVTDSAELILATGANLNGQLERIATNVPFLGSGSLRPLRYGSVQVVPHACFHADANYRGGFACFGPGELEGTLSTTLDRKVSSIRVTSEPLVAYLFTDTKGRGRSFVSEDDVPFLSNFNDVTRSLQVVRRVLQCSTDCPVAYADAWNLSDVVGRMPGPDGRRPRLDQVLLTLKMTNDQDFSVSAGQALQVEFKRRGVRLANAITGQNLMPWFDLHEQTAHVSIAFDFGAPQELTAQLIQSDKAGNFLKTNGFVNIPNGYGIRSTILAIDNNAAWGRGQAVRIKALSMAQAAPIARVQRSSKCWDGPMLGIATYFLGRCGADAATDPVSVYPDALQHTAGAAPTSTFATLKPGAGAVMTLATYVGGQDPMALYAASRTCKTSVAAIVTARHRRGIGDADPCVNRAMTIIALYLTLFGEHWSETEFTQVIANILNHGSTGYAVSVPEVERQLVDAVQQEAATPGADTRMATAVAAYHAANQFYEVSRLGTPDLEAAAARAEGQAGQLPVSQSGPANLAEARTASLGLYRLTLGNFQPRTITPRVLTQGRWYQSLDEFKVEFIRAKERDKTAALGQTLAAWRNRYKELMANQALSQAQRRLASTGNSMASNIQRDIRFGEDNYIYVRVSLGGTTVAILAGSIDDGDGDEETIGSVEAVVSAPDSVVPTSGQNAVRGGASFALQSFLRYAEAYGVTEVHSHVITTPSAIIHGRAGFTLIDERDDWKPPT